MGDDDDDDDDEANVATAPAAPVETEFVPRATRNKPSSLADTLDAALERVDQRRHLRQSDTTLRTRSGGIRRLSAAIDIGHVDLPPERVEMRECLVETPPVRVFRCVARGATFTCKVLSATADKAHREMARREINVLAQLSHRNVVQFAGQHQVGRELRVYLEFFLTTLADV